MKFKKAFQVFEAPFFVFQVGLVKNI